VEYVGQNIRRSDVVNKVTGRLEYMIDSSGAGMLHGRVLRSDYAHARILKIDIAEAQSVPGVVLVLIASGLPQPVPRFGPVVADQPILADKVTRFHGEPVALVLAVDDDSAAAAVRKIRVEYEVLPAVCTVDAALQPDAPVLHPGMKRLDGKTCDSNVAGESHYGWGDVDKARGQCATIIEDVYTFPMIHHHSLEPICSIAYPGNGEVTVKTPTQSPFIMQRVVAACLGLDLAKVRIIASDIGGGFGGRGYPKLEPLAAYAAMRTGKPVKIVTSLEDSFFTVRRLAAKVTISTGFDAEGRIVFQDVNADFLMGAYADAAPRIAQKAGYTACGPYRTPNARIVSRSIYSNTVLSSACRGFGMPQLGWAVESQLNAASRKLNIDPLEIRLRNLPAKGEVFIPGDTPCDGEWIEDLKKCASMVGWSNPKKNNVGRGIALGIKNPIPASVSNAWVKFQADNSVTVAVGTTEMGQGAKTVFAQIAAEILKIPIERITVIMGDTGVVPFDFSTAASRSTVTMGSAVEAACKDLLNQFQTIARELRLIDVGEPVEFVNGMLKGRRNAVSYVDLLRQFSTPSLSEITGKGVFNGQKDPRHPLGGLSDFWEVVFVSAEVEVNPATGKTKVNKLASVGEAGFAINPLQAEAQEEGSLVMGLGHSLMEELLYDESGRLLNAGPLDYRVPTSMDIPEIHSYLAENRDGPGPFGAKGIGEGPVMAVAPAIAGAIYDAVGLTFKELPITSERVWRALNCTKPSGMAAATAAPQ
jgi:CO/xanthine dehydrogenase Mo-binding subunit